MKIGLLKCDTPHPDLINIAGDYSDMFVKLFSDFVPEVELIIYDVAKEEYPASIDEVQGYISTGSKFSVYDNEPWILSLKDFVKVLHEKKKKFIGVCFGHQMIAEAIGGRVKKSEKGWNIGVKDVDITLNKSWMNPSLNNYNLIFIHRDQVTDLPPDSLILGNSSHCKYPMYMVDDHFLGIQAHPEFEPEYAKALIQSRLELIGFDAVEESLSSMDLKLNRKEMANWMSNFIKA